jgi:hypothetical protein
LKDEKINKLGTIVNGRESLSEGNAFGTYYLLRATIAKFALDTNLVEEQIYPSEDGLKTEK